MRILTKSMGVITLFLLLSNSAFAQFRFWVWQPTPEHARFILPRWAGESAEQSYQRYIKSFNSKPDLLELLSLHRAFLPLAYVKDGKLNVPMGSMQSLESVLGGSKRPTQLLYANEIADYAPRVKRIENWQGYFRAREVPVFILPIAPELGLPKNLNFDLDRTLGRTFNGHKHLGGDDNDQTIRSSGRNAENPNALAENLLVPTRDRSEYQRARTIMQMGIAFQSGVCKGHQMLVMAASGHYSIVGDIEKVLRIPSHRSGTHPITPVPGTFMAELYAILPGGLVNSIHHQAGTGLETGGPLKAAAFDPHGVLEAAEFVNGMGLTTQFHPELMGHKVAHKYVELVERGLRISQEKMRLFNEREKLGSSVRSCKAVSTGR